MNLRILLFVIPVVLSSSIRADEIGIELKGVSELEGHYFTYNLDEKELSNGMIVGTELKSSSHGKYHTSDKSLIYENEILFKTTEILYEAAIKDRDILVLRYEFNSYSSPKKILSALAGHPVQTSQIYLIIVKDGAIEFSKELIKKDSEYEWIVKVEKQT